MSRQSAREDVFKLLFEAEVGKKDADETMEIYQELSTWGETWANKDITAKDREYIKSTFFGAMENIPMLDETIQKNSKGWDIKRFSKVTLSLLRLAIFEIEKVEDVPHKVAIKESLLLAKKYDNEEASKFINGVLAGVLGAD